MDPGRGGEFWYGIVVLAECYPIAHSTEITVFIGLNLTDLVVFALSDKTLGHLGASKLSREFTGNTGYGTDTHLCFMMPNSLRSHAL
jgi:hypothetical protein